MAKFKTHISIATGAAFITGLSAYDIGIVTAPQAIYIIILCLIGSILPDIDSPNSLSKEWIFTILGSIAALIFMFSLVIKLGILLSLFLSVCIYISITRYIKEIIAKFCVHRGIIHSFPAALIFSSIVVIFMNIITHNLILSWLSGIFLCIGFLIHLLLDEFCSIDFHRMKFKKSFGTALSFFSYKNIITYLIAYVFLFCLFFLLPIDKFTPFLYIKLIVQNIINNLIPNKFSF